jgi:N-acetylglucosamine kinase-like BadF-type ATPase
MVGAEAIDYSDRMADPAGPINHAERSGTAGQNPGAEPPALPLGQGPDLGLGLDVGGTEARWALADAQGQLLAEGLAAGFSGTQVHDEAGREQVRAALRQVAAGVAAAAPRARLRVWAGVTGHDPQAGPVLAQCVQQCLQQALGCAPQTLELDSDIALLARVAFAPGQGVVVVAGTGSVAVHRDAQGRLHRVGGRGGLLGDEGSGYGIAREALAAVWRHEDDEPGFIARSVLAQELLDALGGRDWAHTRRFVYGGSASRGDFGRLALAVARAADRDPMAQALLERAGAELARLATLLVQRHGAQQVLVCGRVPQLHPAVARSLHARLPAGVACTLRQVAVHREAALQAARVA